MVGQTGLIGALLIVAFANFISIITGLSISAISTSMNVRTGGVYYMLGRTFGREVGGAIGIPLYVSQAIVTAFYVIGFSEATELWFGEDANWVIDATPYIGVSVLLIFGYLAYRGADFVIKIQYFVMGILALAIIAFFASGWGANDFVSDRKLWSEPSDPKIPGLVFFGVFAVFFPAVTGIEVGASMSGDLRNPSKAIPRGTIWSIIVTALIYFAAVIWLWLHASEKDLRENLMIMRTITWGPVQFLILLGVYAATLSSALGSILAAPRTLQAIAFDRVVPKIFGSTLKSKTEPRVAVILTTAIAIPFVWIGELDFVAKIIAMFFLHTNGMINFAAGIEKLVGNPSYRPKFNLPWWVPILGALGCYAAMFLIDAPITMIAIAASFGIYVYLKRKSLASDWGDVRSGVWFTVARHALLKLESSPLDSKNWRPNVLAFTGQPRRREHLVEVGEWLSSGQGIVSFVQLLTGDMGDLAGKGLRDTAKKQMQDFIRERDVVAFAECEIAPNFADGALTVAQAHGIAGLEPNSVLMGWSETDEGRASQLKLVRNFTALKKSVMLLNYNKERGYGERKWIDVWWGGRSRNGELMLLLAHLFSQHRSWSGCSIRLLQIINSEEGRAPTEKILKRMLRNVRLEATPVAVVRGDKERPVREVIAATSEKSDLTIIGMGVPEPDNYESMANELESLVEPLGSVMLVRSAEAEDVLDTEARSSASH